MVPNTYPIRPPAIRAAVYRKISVICMFIGISFCLFVQGCARVCDPAQPLLQLCLKLLNTESGGNHWFSTGLQCVAFRHRSLRLFIHYETGIAGDAHFWKIKTFNFNFL